MPNERVIHCYGGYEYEAVDCIGLEGNHWIVAPGGPSDGLQHQTCYMVAAGGASGANVSLTSRLAPVRYARTIFAINVA